MWHQYQSLTSALSQQLCEQLRLILEPTQAAKLKSVPGPSLLHILNWKLSAAIKCVCVWCFTVDRGDYRTGKRLNIRKVIPYIASQFRKDKIWLRRTKLSKREYHICLAVDDSSSMVDNHSKQVRACCLVLKEHSGILQANPICLPIFCMFESHSFINCEVNILL